MEELTPILVELLNGTHYATLATYDSDETIHLTPVWYIYINKKVYVPSSSTSRKYKNIIRKPLASILIDVRQAGKEQWINLLGNAYMLMEKESQVMNSRIMKRYLTEEAIMDPQIGPFYAVGDDATICIEPKKYRTWSMEERDNKHFGGMLGKTPNKWFLQLDP